MSEGVNAEWSVRVGGLCDAYHRYRQVAGLMRCIPPSEWLARRQLSLVRQQKIGNRRGYRRLGNSRDSGQNGRRVVVGRAFRLAGCAHSALRRFTTRSGSCFPASLTSPHRACSVAYGKVSGLPFTLRRPCHPYRPCRPYRQHRRGRPGRPPCPSRGRRRK